MQQDKFLHILPVEVGLERTVLPNNYSDFKSVEDYCEIKPWITMQTLEFKTHLHVYENIAALDDPQERVLCRHAIAAQNHAYSVYSGFRVGAAVLLDDGTIMEGSNQENAIYPLGLCAERVAINSANTLHHNQIIKSLALITDAKIQKGEIPTFPCGSCRQVIAEQEYRQSKPMRLLILGSGDQVYVAESIVTILPFIMNKDTLG